MLDIKPALKIKYPDFNLDSEVDTEMLAELDKLNLDRTTTSGTTRTIKNIRKNLLATLKANYSITDKNKLKEIADKILSIHGLREENFDFVKQFEDGLMKRISEVSTDENANKNEKVMRGYLNEIEKSVDKLIGYDVLYRILKEMYGEKEAKKLTGEMYSYALGLSDSSAINIPYSYYAHTPIIIIINGQQELVSLKQLFEKFKDFVISESDYEWIDTNNIEVDYKPFNAKLGNRAKNIGKRINLLKEYPKTKIILKVWDTKNGWVDITRIVRHKNNVGFTLYQLDDGNFAFVTDNHPIYMADGTEKNAIDLNIGDRVLVDDDMSVPTGDANIIIPKKLAYFTGFLLGDGNVNSYDKEQVIYKPLSSPCYVKFIRGGNTVGIYQNDVDNSYIKKVAEDLFDNFKTWRPSDKVERSIFFSSYEYAFICSTFFDFGFEENSFTKHLPHNILNWDTTSKEALLAGLIDSDGTIFNNRVNCVSIRMMSYSIIRGLYDILKTLPGIHNVRTRIDGVNISNCIYEIVFSVTKESGLCYLSEKIKTQYNLNPKKYDAYHAECNSKKPIKNVVTKVIRFTSDEISDTRFLKRELEYVYDITTSTGRFYANGMVQHNCFAFDASKLVTIGRDFGVLKSKPAKRVSSYISALCETIHQMSNHLAGAVAIGTFFFDLAHIMIYKERRTLNEIKTDKRIRKTIENEIQQFIHSVNHLSRNGVESPFTNVSIFDRIKLKKFLEEDQMGWYFPNHKAVSTDNDLEDKMSNEAFEDYVMNYILELQNLYLDFFEKGDPSQNGMPYRFPVSTICFSKHKNDKGEWEIEDKEFEKSICKRDVSRFNLFNSEGDKIASCCRLLSDSEMIDIAAQSNSFGAGGSISIGSHRVVTVNFQRIALECKSFEDYKNILTYRTKECAKILKAHKMLIMKFAKEGYEPFISNGFINPRRLFSTFGILGIYEANKTLKLRFPELKAQDVIKELLIQFNKEMQEFSKEYGITGNIEQIPGESYAVRFAEADKAIFDLDDNYYKLYANQFCPLYENFSIFDKIETDGKYNQLLTGGGIVHIQAASDTTPQQNEKLLDYACKSGCEHYAINKVFSKCSKCGAVKNHKVEKCECGAESPNIEYYTRIVGFFTPVNSWNTVRREWEFPRRRFTDLSGIK